MINNSYVPGVTAAAIEAAVPAVEADAPELTAEQVARLIALLTARRSDTSHAIA